jgi:mannosyltransferase OCH1-like enzyme
MSNLDFLDLDMYLKAQKGRIIHQVWFGTIPNKIKAKQTYKSLKKYRDSWKIKNPTWFHVEWNKEICVLLIKNFYVEYEDMFKNYSYEIQRCDAIRYFILHRYGGLYADMDYYCNKSWDEVLKEYPNDLYLVQTPNRSGEYVSNSLMYSTPENKFWKYVFLDLTLHKTCPYYYTRHLVIMFTTGPGIINRIYSKRKISCKLSYYPSKYFHPYGIGDSILSLNVNPKYYAIHLGKGSWEKNDSKMFLIVFREWRMLLFILIYFLIMCIFLKIDK